MAQDLVGLYNLALNAIGTRSRVALPNETSREAEVCQLWYPPIRDSILRAAHWQGTKKSAVLAILAIRDFDLAWADGDPDADWIYAYALPSDYLYARSITALQHFELGMNNGAKALFANVENVRLDYTATQEAPSLWSPDLYLAVAHGLAAHISMPLHGKVSRAKLAFDLANEAIIRARLRTANEQHRAFESVPDWLSVRGVGQLSAHTGYIYPHGPLLTMTIAE